MLIVNQALPVCLFGVSLEAFAVYAALAIGDTCNPSARYILAKRLAWY
jgi:hypothetical protein